MRVTVEPVHARMRAPFAAAWGTISERELLLVRLEADDGAVGWGEAVPLPGYGGASAEQVRTALAAYGDALAGMGPGSPADLLAACAAASDLPQALAAVDLALWDLEGRRRGQPVWRLLGQTAAPEVTVNATIAATEPALVSREVASARAAGYRCTKVKVGLGDDVERLVAARSAGAEMAIRIDANGAWSVARAIASLEALAPFGLELCEEPVHGVEETAEVAAASAVPIALDETTAVAGALERRVCDAACLKVASSAGISGLLERAAQARAGGYRVYLASTLDGPLGIAAALHAAAVIGPELACGLATLPAFADRPDPLPARGGRIAPPSGPGLGDGLLQWYG